MSLLIHICNQSAKLDKLVIKQDERLEQLAPALDLVKEALKNETMPTIAQITRTFFTYAIFNMVFLQAKMSALLLIDPTIRAIVF